MDFLRRIEESTFPLEVSDPNDIHNTAVLVAAGLVEAAVPLEGDSPSVPAVIMRITPMGRAALHRMHTNQA